MATQANQPLPDGYQLENYRIASVLSCGGFSIVYLAYDENDQPVAIKEYLPSQLALRRHGDVLPAIAEENLATFRYGMRCFFEEGRALAGLSHANVVRVLNFFRANETVYLVMRYEHGRTLEEHIRHRFGTLRENFIRHMFAQLLNGLREVHSNKLLHLDIKPDNVYLGAEGACRIGDFGLAVAKEGDAVRRAPRSGCWGRQAGEGCRWSLLCSRHWGARAHCACPCVRADPRAAAPPTTPAGLGRGRRRLRGARAAAGRARAHRRCRHVQPGRHSVRVCHR